MQTVLQNVEHRTENLQFPSSIFLKTFLKIFFKILWYHRVVAQAVAVAVVVGRQEVPCSRFVNIS